MKYTTTLLALFFGLQSFAQELQENLLVRYNFDGNTLDSSGNDRHGQAYGGMTYGDDRYGNPNSAAYFNGLSSYMNFPNIAELKPQLPMSFSFWILYSSEDFHQQVVFNTSFEENHCTGVWFNSSLMNNGHAINYGNGEYAYAPWTRRTFLGDRQIPTNAWHKVVIVVNSESDMQIHLGLTPMEGSYNGSGGPLIYSDTPGCIGRHDRYLDADPDYFKGYIDEFMYWDRALTMDEIEMLRAPSLETQAFSAKSTVRIYPNPTNGMLHLDTAMEGRKTVKMYDVLGQLVISCAYESQIDVSSIQGGMYLLEVSNGQESVTERIVIK